MFPFDDVIMDRVGRDLFPLLYVPMVSYYSNNLIYCHEDAMVENHFEAVRKWSPFADNILNAFHWLRRVILDKDITEIHSQGTNRQYASIGSDHGLAPNRHQAVILTNGA